jgi:hypothetical protein
VSVTVCPATVSEPVLSAPLFSVTLMRTDPLPEPVAPSTTAIHVAWLLALQEQLLVVCTAIGVPEPEVWVMLWLVGDTEYVHDGGGAAA